MSFITDAQTGSNFSRRGMVFHGGVNDVMLMVAGDFLSFFYYLQSSKRYDNTSCEAFVD